MSSLRSLLFVSTAALSLLAALPAAAAPQTVPVAAASGTPFCLEVGPAAGKGSADFVVCITAGPPSGEPSIVDPAGDPDLIRPIEVEPDTATWEPPAAAEGLAVTLRWGGTEEGGTPRSLTLVVSPRR